MIFVNWLYPHPHHSKNHWSYCRRSLGYIIPSSRTRHNNIHTRSIPAHDISLHSAWREMRLLDAAITINIFPLIFNPVIYIQWINHLNDRASEDEITVIRAKVYPARCVTRRTSSDCPSPVSPVVVASMYIQAFIWLSKKCIFIWYCSIRQNEYT